MPLMRRGKLIATVLLFALIFWRMEDVAGFWSAIVRMSWTALAIALLINTADRFLMTYKWLRLLAARGFPFSVLDGLKIYCTAMIWGQFLPSSVGADAIRAWSTTRAGASSHEVLASIAVERLGGVFVTAAVAMGGLLLLGESGRADPRLSVVWWASAGLSAAALVAIAVSASSRIYRLVHDRVLGRFSHFRMVQLLGQFHATFQSYRHHAREVAIFLGLTAAEQIFPIVATLVIAMGAGIEVSPVYIVAGVPIAFLFSRIPVSLGGLGVYEGMFALILAAGGVPIAESVAISLSARVVETVSLLPWWLMHTRRSGTFRRPRLEPEVVR